MPRRILSVGASNAIHVIRVALPTDLISLSFVLLSLRPSVPRRSTTPPRLTSALLLTASAGTCYIAAAVVRVNRLPRAMFQYYATTAHHVEPSQLPHKINVNYRFTSCHLSHSSHYSQHPTTPRHSTPNYSLTSCHLSHSYSQHPTTHADSLTIRGRQHIQQVITAKYLSGFVCTEDTLKLVYRLSVERQLCVSTGGLACTNTIP